MQRTAHFLLVLLVCFTAITAAGRFLPLSKGVSDTYLQGFLKGRKLLEQSMHAPQRVLLLSGSSLGWSVSAEALTAELGMPVINLGVQASMGYRNIWNFYAPYLRPDRDIIVFSAAYEMMFEAQQGPTRTWCDVLFLQGRQAPFDLACSAAGAQRIVKNLIYLATGKEKINIDYSADGFNAHGDYVLHLDRPNRKVDHYKDQGLDRLVNGKTPEEFIRFFQAKQAAGYRLVYLPPTVPEVTCNHHNDAVAKANETIAEPFGQYFGRDFPFCVAGDLFFNTHYHLNHRGRQIKTGATLRVIERYLD